MISPQLIEQKIAVHPDIEHAIIYGHGKPFLVAAIFPSVELLSDLENTSQKLELLREKIDKHIKQVNITLDSKSRVKKFLILGHELTIADGTLTPSLKVKRNHIYQTYANQIESLFQESVSAIS